MKPSALAQPAASRSAAQPATEWQRHGQGQRRHRQQAGAQRGQRRRGGHAAAINAPSR